MARSGFYFCRLHEAEINREIEQLREKGKTVNLGRIVLAMRGEDPRNYLIRDIPDELWRMVKSKASQEGRTIREMLLDALRDYVKDK